jgi:glucose/mannose-6-phosphate isomerase
VVGEHAAAALRECGLRVLAQHLRVLMAAAATAASLGPLDETFLRIHRSGLQQAGLKEADANPAKQLAMRLHDKVPIIYGAEVTSGVAFRWKCQFNENAKQPSFWAALPEMNHNEIVGWEQAGTFGEQAQVVMLRDPRQHRQVERRLALTREIIKDGVTDVLTAENGPVPIALIAAIFSV